MIKLWHSEVDVVECWSEAGGGQGTGVGAVWLSAVPAGTSLQAARLLQQGRDLGVAAGELLAIGPAALLHVGEGVLDHDGWTAIPIHSLRDRSTALTARGAARP